MESKKKVMGVEKLACTGLMLGDSGFLKRIVLADVGHSTLHPNYICSLVLSNWSRYGLPHAYGDSMIADDTCLDDERLTGHVPCSTPCMTINITAVGGKHDGKVQIDRNSPVLVN
ncbi:unnamed protein product [Strongylus vulgaris]|uniref:Uncharacterized protein n=1 Tax=Strongylus vulgaris TaxID=40348 RepID=A0A3P7J5K7_STRVU|nr:unnamed protein product [Strongylus vulgaris]